MIAAKIHGTAKVDGKLVAEGTLSCQLVDGAPEKKSDGNG
jgi:3-hydroxymyristoyl/3-hydroxydecanoyl-(acyl carrier protein) dehydratase